MVTERAELLASSLATALFAPALGLLLFAVWRRRVPLMAAALGVVLLYLLLGAQYFHPWYLLWLAPFAALAPVRQPRILATAFVVLGPLTYVFNHKPLPVVLTVFLPILLLTLRWRRWLIWPGPDREDEEAPPDPARSWAHARA
jgi:hypothetical protein